MADQRPSSVRKRPAQAAPRCPECGKPRDERYRPFCSARCRDADLHRWLKEEYAVPAHEVEPDDDG